MDVTVSSLGDAKPAARRHLYSSPPARRRRQRPRGNAGPRRARSRSAASSAEYRRRSLRITRGVPTVGRIANGAIIEREIEFALNRPPMSGWRCATPISTPPSALPPRSMRFSRHQDCRADRSSTVQLAIPAEFEGNVVAFLTEIEQLQVDPDLAAKIVIDERLRHHRDGLRRPCRHRALAQGTLTVTISLKACRSASRFPRARVRRTVVDTAHQQRRGHRRRQEIRAGEGRRLAAAAGRRPQRSGHRSAPT